MSNARAQYYSYILCTDWRLASKTTKGPEFTRKHTLVPVYDEEACDYVCKNYIKLEKNAVHSDNDKSPGARPVEGLDNCKHQTWFGLP